jgi:type II secretory pathway predicted ATPase ExeA
MLSLKAFKKFGLTQDPFIGDVLKNEDVFLTDDTRFIAEYMLTSAKIGGMVALVGESGSGKTTIRRFVIDRIQQESHKVKVIVPRCIDKTRLSAASICDAIIADCSEAAPKRSLEAKARQVEKTLTASSEAGYSHVLMIEEAHDLSMQTLKYLKRFWELEHGFKKLLSIMLIGQPELKAKLDESRNWEAREVIRRIELLEINPLASGEDIARYLEIKFSRLEKKRTDIIDDSGCKALATKLVRKTRTEISYSVAFPLLINNWTRRAMNQAAALGAAIVDGEVVNSL